MTGKLKTNYEARKNRLRRRLVNGVGEFFGALCLLMSAVMLCSCFIYAYSFVLSSSYFEIKETSVRGLKELTEKDILELADLKTSQNILAVNTETVASRISVNPWVKNVYIGRELPDRIVVEVRERSPIALVKQGGDFYLMDGEGFVFKKLSKGDEVDLAIITGVNLQGKSKSKLLTDTLGLLKTIYSTEQYAFLGTISEVHVDELFGLSLLTDKGLHLKMGADGFESKLKQLNVVMADVEKRGWKNGYLCVDMGDANKITVQRKNTQGRTDQGRKSKEYKI